MQAVLLARDQRLDYTVSRTARGCRAHGLHARGPGSLGRQAPSPTHTTRHRGSRHPQVPHGMPAGVQLRPGCAHCHNHCRRGSAPDDADGVLVTDPAAEPATAPDPDDADGVLVTEPATAPDPDNADGVLVTDPAAEPATAPDPDDADGVLVTEPATAPDPDNADGVLVRKGRASTSRR